MIDGVIIVPDRVPGASTGIPFPPTIETLLAAGPEFLTRAFQTTGALEPENRVTAIRSANEFEGGGMGRKLWLSVTYEQPQPHLHTELFVKFPRDFGDPLRELFGPLMEPEVRFALLSRRDDFPIAVPTCYFADYDPASKSGILITERIFYGQGAIEPCHDKCLDYLIDDPLPHYQALTRSMARLAAFHKSGRFGDEVDRSFPFHPEQIDGGTRIPYTPEQLREKLEKLKSFAQTYPQLLPVELRAVEFLAGFTEDAQRVLQQESAINRFLNRQSQLVALCHWNMNLDNAWFWRDAGEELQVGLLDWGSVGQMNVAKAFYGMTCAAEADFLVQHRRGLIELFADEYRHSGGPTINTAEFLLQYKLAVAVLGIAWILDAPSLVETEVPNLGAVRDRTDPQLRDVFLARAQLQLLTVFLSEWRSENIGEAVRHFSA